MKQGTLSIDIQIPEKDFMESCLNLTASKINTDLLIGFYALGKSWHFNKLIYYNNLLKEVEDTIQFNNQQIKKNNSDGSNTNYLETRSTTKEDNKQEHKFGCVDNQSVDNIQTKKGWGRPYGY